MSAKNISGKYGEMYAARHLEKNGYKILTRNYRARGSEIDIIAVENNTLCFVEVKTRKSKDYGAASEAVNYFKREKMILGAKCFLASRRTNMPIRFDVVEVYGNIRPAGFDVSEINIIKNAFDV